MNRKQVKERAARYAKFVEWSDEDHCFIGRCPGLFAGGVHGNDEARVYKELCKAVEEWIELLHKDKAPLPEVLERCRTENANIIELTLLPILRE